MKNLIKNSSRGKTTTALLISASAIVTAAACAVLFSCDNEDKCYENETTLRQKRVTRSYSDRPDDNTPETPTDDPSMY